MAVRIKHVIEYVLVYIAVLQPMFDVLLLGLAKFCFNEKRANFAAVY